MQPPDQRLLNTEQIAARLGMNPVSVRRWRMRNRQCGVIRFGPPYEYRGRNVVYPEPAFVRWLNQVTIVDGAQHFNAPLSVQLPLPAEAGTSHGS